MKKIYSLLNMIVIVIVIFWNYWANAANINGKTIGEISAEYNSLFTPAGYAFSIWGLIYLGLLIHGIYQLKCAFSQNEKDGFILKLGPWLAIANIGNGAWIWFWLQEQAALSILVMTVIMVSLIIIILRLNMERWDAPNPIIFFVWWPICIYSGWITVAMIANISAHLAHNGWSPFFSEITWTLIMICLAVIINVLMVYTRNMREFAAVGIWALIAIAVKHWGEIELLQWAAISGVIILSIVVMIHSYKNRDTNPLLR